jgi:hypothetical protein
MFSFIGFVGFTHYFHLCSNLWLVIITFDCLVWHGRLILLPLFPLFFLCSFFVDRYELWGDPRLLTTWNFHLCFWWICCWRLRRWWKKFFFSIHECLFFTDVRSFKRNTVLCTRYVMNLIDKEWNVRNVPINKKKRLKKPVHFRFELRVSSGLTIRRHSPVDSPNSSTQHI